MSEQPSPLTKEAKQITTRVMVTITKRYRKFSHFLLYLPPSFCFAFSLSHYLILYFDCVRNVNESFDSAKCNIVSTVAQNSAIYPIKMNTITSSEGNSVWKCAQTCPNAVWENPNKRLATSRICHSLKAWGFLALWSYSMEFELHELLHVKNESTDNLVGWGTWKRLFCSLPFISFLRNTWVVFWALRGHSLALLGVCLLCYWRRNICTWVCTIFEEELFLHCWWNVFFKICWFLCKTSEVY